MTAPLALFLSQGRAAESAALGHVRARHALEAAPPDPATIRIQHAEVPPFSLPERLLLRRVPALKDLDFWTLRWHLLRGWKARRLIERELQAARPDVVHVTTDQVALVLGRLQRRVPCVLSLDITTRDWIRLLRRLPSDRPDPPDLAPLTALERRALQHAPLSIAWTETVAASIRALAPAAEVATLHPGLDLEAFRPAVKRPRARVRVLFVGGRWADKGGPELVRALEPRLGRDVELHVVAPASAPVPGLPGIERHSASPGSGDAAARFRDADILCLPTYVDAVPWAVLEALACGVPVVTTTIGSLPEMAGDGCGLLVEPGDVRGLEGALGALVDDAQLRRSTGEAARVRAEERYDARRNTPRLLEILRDAAPSGPA